MKMQAYIAGLQQYKCAWPICPNARPLKRETILKHFHAYGKHPRN